MFTIVVTLLVVVVILIVAILVAIAGLYAFLGLAKANILWTIVDQGWCKIILRWGEYDRTVGPGLHWVGIPGIFTLYSRTMTFLKSVTNEKGEPQAEPHEDKDINSFKTTEYPYALPFKDEEDSHGLHLSGILAAFAVIEDYEKAFFVVSDWYSKMNTKILSCHRKVIAQVSYDDNIVGRDTEEEQIRKTINERLWEELNHKQNGNLSIIEELLDVCGIRVNSVALRSIDPPDSWRATTLAPYKAQREKDAAKHQAEASAILFDDTNQALKIWIESQRTAGHSPTQVQIEAKQDELRQRALAKTPGYQQIHIKGLEGATTAVVGGGGGMGVMIGGGNPGGGKSSKSSSKGGKKTAEEMEPEDLEKEMERIEKETEEKNKKP